jgi:hypothetical protein
MQVVAPGLVRLHPVGRAKKATQQFANHACWQLQFALLSSWIAPHCSQMFIWLQQSIFPSLPPSFSLFFHSLFSYNAKDCEPPAVPGFLGCIPFGFSKVSIPFDSSCS